MPTNIKDIPHTHFTLSLGQPCRLMKDLLNIESGVCGKATELCLSYQNSDYEVLNVRTVGSTDILDTKTGATIQVKTACGTYSSNKKRINYDTKINASSSRKYTSNEYRRLFDKFIFVDMAKYYQEGGLLLLDAYIVDSEDLKGIKSVRLSSRASWHTYPEPGSG